MMLSLLFQDFIICTALRNKTFGAHWNKLTAEILHHCLTLGIVLNHEMRYTERVQKCVLTLFTVCL